MSSADRDRLAAKERTLHLVTFSFCGGIVQRDEITGVQFCTRRMWLGGCWEENYGTGGRRAVIESEKLTMENEGENGKSSGNNPRGKETPLEGEISSARRRHCEWESA